MKKLLLVGAFNNITQGISDCLTDQYQVQLCSLVLEDIQGMVKIVKPNLIVICQVGMMQVDTKLFNWLDEYWSHIPVLVVTTQDEWDSLQLACMGKQYDHLFRPINKKTLSEKCEKMLGIGKELEAGSLIQLSGRRKTILVVDDDAMMIRSIREMLQEKYDVIAAMVGEKALQLVERKKPDLVLLDYAMPGMDGKRVFERILEMEYRKNTPVVFMTAVSDRKKIIEVLQHKPAGYVLKPPDKDKLMGKIEEVLKFC